MLESTRQLLENLAPSPWLDLLRHVSTSERGGIYRWYGRLQEWGAEVQEVANRALGALVLPFWEARYPDRGGPRRVLAALDGKLACPACVDPTTTHTCQVHAEEVRRARADLMADLSTSECEAFEAAIRHSIVGDVGDRPRARSTSAFRLGAVVDQVECLVIDERALLRMVRGSLIERALLAERGDHSDMSQNLTLPRLRSSCEGLGAKPVQARLGEDLVTGVGVPAIASREQTLLVAEQAERAWCACATIFYSSTADSAHFAARVFSGAVSRAAGVRPALDSGQVREAVEGAVALWVSSRVSRPSSSGTSEAGR